MAEKRKDKDGRLLPENVIQRKDGSYMWKKMIDGKQYCEYAKTLGDIKQKRNKALYEIEKGTYAGKHKKLQQEREQAKKDITLNEWFFQWEKMYRIGVVKEATLQKDHRAYLQCFSDNIGKMKIKDIKQIDIVSVNKELRDSGLKYTSVLSYNVTLKAVFASALSNGLIENNPVIGALKISKDEPMERRILTEEEQKILFDFLSMDSKYKIYKPLFTVAFYTGMRIGEILGLTWEDVDMEQGVIHVYKTLAYLPDYVNKNKRRFVVNSPKTKKSVRDVPMLIEVKEAFEEQKKMNLKSNIEIDGLKDFIFLTRNGTPYTNANICSIIRRIVARINEQELARAKEEKRNPVEFEYFSPHCCRHTFATRCYERGVREKVVQEILGHTSLDMTLNRYTHVTQDMIDNEIEKLK